MSKKEQFFFTVAEDRVEMFGKFRAVMGVLNEMKNPLMELVEQVRGGTIITISIGVHKDDTESEKKEVANKKSAAKRGKSADTADSPDASGGEDDGSGDGDEIESEAAKPLKLKPADDKFGDLSDDEE